MKNKLKMNVNVHRTSVRSLGSKNSKRNGATSSENSTAKQRKDEVNRPMYLNRYE